MEYAWIFTEEDRIRISVAEYDEYLSRDITRKWAGSNKYEFIETGSCLLSKISRSLARSSFSGSRGRRHRYSHLQK
jgi:hypothetical protein